MMTCASCGKVIILPTGEVDPTALKGDLCDKCIEDEFTAGQVAEEIRENDRLRMKLRERP